jgi:hypothetical protein
LDLGDIGGSSGSGTPSTTTTPSVDGTPTPTNANDGIDFVALDREEDAAARFIHALVDACIDIDINEVPMTYILKLLTFYLYAYLLR